MVLEGHCRLSSFKGLKARYLREGSLSLVGSEAISGARILAERITYIGIVS
jgi:hypothetical protein